MELITELNNKECSLLISELTPLERNLNKKIAYLMQEMDLSLQQALDYVVNDSPVLWGKVYLNWTAKNYQVCILEQGKKRKALVLRLGRRLGKTECDCILILWHAIMQPNIGDNGQYDILIIAPYETQINLIFKRLKEIIEGSEYLQSQIKTNIQSRIEFKNGTSIIGLTAGSKNNTGAANTRGQHANVIVIDESDYVGTVQLTNIINIKNDNPEKVKVIATSTPSGKHEEFYKWCTNATYHYTAKKEDIENYKFTGYDYYENTDVDEKGRRVGNGWTEIYAPSTVNENLVKINPDTGITYLDELRSELSEMRFAQEVMAEFGEQESGVYSYDLLEKAVNEGKRIGLKYVSDMDENDARIYKNRRGVIRFLGCDWDKNKKTGTNIVIVEYDKRFRNIKGETEPKLKIIHREEIPKSKFTYMYATKRIIDLNEEYHLNHITIDKGYGEVQTEMLDLYGEQHPETGISQKLRAYQFSEKVEVTDPFTKKKDKKPLKPLMVTYSVILFERGKIVLNPNDRLVIEQFSQYSIKHYSSVGLPVFTDENEHTLDCINLCLLTFALNYEPLFKQMTRTTIASLNKMLGDNEEINAKVDRSIDIVSSTSTLSVASMPKQILDLTPGPRKKKKRSINQFSREIF